MNKPQKFRIRKSSRKFYPDILQGFDESARKWVKMFSISENFDVQEYVKSWNGELID